MENTLTIDALIEESDPSWSNRPMQQPTITLKNVSDAEKYLDMMEKVSLVYLLYDDIEIALQHLIQLQRGAIFEVIVEWVRHAEKTGRQWQTKLIEALTIIQNFHLIYKLGYNRKEVCERFLPSNSETSLFVDLYKKKLYCICEKMTNAQMETFLGHVQKDFNTKKLKYMNFPVPYMEMYLLHWISSKYISPTDLSNLTKVFKVMEMYDACESLKIKLPSPADVSERYNNNKDEPYSSISSATSSASFYQDRTWSSNYENNRYFIDSRWPGICLIINQESFYTEPDPSLAHLLPNVSLQLDRREGTIFDREELRKTFEQLGYTVEIENNLTHDEILRAITDTANKIRKHSSLIICILSHGLEGRVFGVNSISVNISQIRDTVCSVNTTHLRNKPKILILQSCQGTECQTVSDDEDDDNPVGTPNKTVLNSFNNQHKESNVQTDSESNLQMDGGSRPKLADVLLFWATVPGFGAVRDKAKGSWFIQSLCKHIQEKALEMHFEDICTLVKQEVIDKRWKTKKMSRAMVPNKESTLSRFFFLHS
uniref:Caspase family p20 domain-containing protein n=1 Tax=Photinus pyralis TaxID=7054 RepID=A0A1Y1MQM3_PHOPY